jgi:hypothetical protein
LWISRESNSALATASALSKVQPDLLNVVADFSSSATIFLNLLDFLKLGNVLATQRELALATIGDLAVVLLFGFAGVLDLLKPSASIRHVLRLRATSVGLVLPSHRFVL